MTKIRIADVSLIACDKVGEAQDRPYLSLYRLTAVNTYSDGTTSPPYSYDAVLRKWLDAVVIILTATVEGKQCILLRSAIRPPLLIRHMATTPEPELATPVSLFELPAGLIEGTDVGTPGILRRAQLETLEETGFSVPLTSFQVLPGVPFVSPGVLAERIYYVHAVVENPLHFHLPQGDGSPLEDHPELRWLAMGDALKMCDNGQMDDMKTELGIRRAASFPISDAE